MDSTAHWPQGIGVVKPMEASSKQANNNNSNNNSNNMLDQRSRARPQKDQALNCPRCNSTNTKFCYYNNYSLTQPRYFCKTCRRYWTEGGSLRNVPVGGGSRKNKRSSSSTATTTTITSSSSNSLLPISSAPKKLNVDHHHIIPPPSLNFPPDQNPKIHHAQDLNLAYPPTSSHHDHHHHHHNSISTSFVELPYNSTTSIDHNKISHTQNPSTTMELLKTAASRDHGSGLIGSFMSMPVNNPDHHNSNTMFSTGFPNLAQEFKPSLSFGLDHHHHHHGYNMDDHQDGNLHGVQESSTTGVRLLFPSTDDQDLKQVSSTTTTTNTHDHHHHHHHHQHQHQHQHHQFELNIKGQGDISNGYNWNGMLGHGGSW